MPSVIVLDPAGSAAMLGSGAWTEHTCAALAHSERLGAIRTVGAGEDGLLGRAVPTGSSGDGDELARDGSKTRATNGTDVVVVVVAVRTNPTLAHQGITPGVLGRDLLGGEGQGCTHLVADLADERLPPAVGTPAVSPRWSRRRPGSRRRWSWSTGRPDEGPGS